MRIPEIAARYDEATNERARIVRLTYSHSWAVVFILTVRYVVPADTPESTGENSQREGIWTSHVQSGTVWSLGLGEAGMFRDIPSNLANLQFDCSTKEFKQGRD